MVAPIVGKLRKKLITDLSVGIGLGTVIGYGWWYTYALPSLAKRDAYYIKYEQENSS